MTVTSAPEIHTRATPAMTMAARVQSIDILRGAVMVLMAIDHVRVYSGVPAGGPTPGVFFTRWVTHFCAPVFVFLAGTAAFLYARRLHDAGVPLDRVRARLSQYLASRGLLLVALELTLIHLAWTFSWQSMHFLLAGVIWMLGWCMILMAGLVWLPTRAIGTFGVVVILAQNAIGLLSQATPDSIGWFWQLFYGGGEITIGQTGVSVSVLYSIVPWIGVMAAGYAFGSVVTRERVARRRSYLRIGLSITAAFLLVGGLLVVFGPRPDDAPPALFRLLNQQKYPASQLFLAMTLGPAIALLAFAEDARGRLGDMLATFGRVPFFYYLLHIPLIHSTALLVWLIRDGSVNAGRFASAPYVSIPPEDRWTLWLLYVVFIVNVAILYVACGWYARVKARRSSRLLRFL
jgi:uncharacterized membrane protein